MEKHLDRVKLFYEIKLHMPKNKIKLTINFTVRTYITITYFYYIINALAT